MVIGGTGNPEGATHSEPGSEENRIPKSRVDEMVGKAKEETRAEGQRENDRLRQDLDQERRLRADAEARASARSEPKPVTRSELTKMVEDGAITQPQMDAELDRQKKLAEDARIDARVEEAVTTRVVTGDLRAEQDRYIAARPDLEKRGSDDHQKAGVQMQQLLKEGHPDTLRTEVLALRMAFGPIASLERSPDERETHEDGGNVTETGERGTRTQRDAGPPKELDARRRDYYNAEIARGVYTGWDDPKVVRQLKRLGVAD
ncbi:MAG: hypothetical protein ACYSUN_03290 [Planctomycetota bacterium]|jgi:hypothetical protein